MHPLTHAGTTTHDITLIKVLWRKMTRYEDAILLPLDGFLEWYLHINQPQEFSYGSSSSASSFVHPPYTGEEVFNLCYTRRHGLHWNNQRGNFNLHYTTIHRGMQICFRELALFHTTLVYRKSSSVASSPTILFLNTFVTRMCVIALPRKPTDIVYVLLPQRKPRDWQR